ncbi:MAG: mannitol dehydrogenase family protein [Oscillospiraceae bacterium]|jgi:fructuronate reductase|nr:mannitol dehydrogenase family protein [Oscillospiraceae bacterium]
MELTLRGIGDKAGWAAAGVRLPQYDVEAAARRTRENPRWLHFGAGNLLRGYVAALQEELLNAGASDHGIVAVESFDVELIDAIYNAHDSLILQALLGGGGVGGDDRYAVLGSVAGCLSAASDWEELRRIFASPALQMVSFTITEKGYATRDISGRLLPSLEADGERGPASPKHTLAMIASLLIARFEAGGAPVALVSMDNCSANGDKLKAGVTQAAELWRSRGYVGEDFLRYLNDPARVSFPWTMIDKITPSPAPDVYRRLTSLGIRGIDPIQTARGTRIAPYVNTETAQYLVIEDAFPAGRPPLEQAGVYFANRDTVRSAERMKVSACLNPLHTALAVFGCLLGYGSISQEMNDPELAALVRRIGYAEGLPAAANPGIIDPRAFLDEVIERRLPNPAIPDTPQRIAADTSQKVAIRFGETIRSYGADAARKLIGIPLALAGWLRYLLGVDDQLRAMTLSGDPMLHELRERLSVIRIGTADGARAALLPILSNEALWGVDLQAVGLADVVLNLFERMIKGKDAVRETLREALRSAASKD